MCYMVKSKSIPFQIMSGEQSSYSGNQMEVVCIFSSVLCKTHELNQAFTKGFQNVYFLLLRNSF